MDDEDIEVLKKDCIEKHTTYQPGKDKKWRCPKCGATPMHKSGGFYIEEPVEGAHPDCELLHDEDYCMCMACGFAGNGKKVAKMLMEIDHRQVCPTCKGKGTVPQKVKP